LSSLLILLLLLALRQCPVLHSYEFRISKGRGSLQGFQIRDLRLSWRWFFKSRSYGLWRRVALW
jgi:hypothetical protein